MDKNQWYRRIPKVDTLLADEEVGMLIERYGRDSVMEAIHTRTDQLREELSRCEDGEAADSLLAGLVPGIRRTVEEWYTPNLRPVINGTGTILHTNLGRAPICERHMKQLSRLMTGYANLEYDLEAGKRGERYASFAGLLCRLTGAEAAMAVNNNAAAVMLVLDTLTRGREVVVSRGELVEIGGKFRIPDVMERSGATLVEVGTTNKTHYEDYERAISPETAAILKVHKSNYSIVGFSEEVELSRLAPLAKERGLVLIEDLGSGLMVDLGKYGLPGEPTVPESIAKGADLVCFSGDKLLGGPQAGIIIGKKKYIDEIKKNQLTRAFRIDKFTAAALELVLMEYQSEERALRNIPVLRMLTKTREETLAEAKSLARMLKREGFPAEISVCPCESKVGGGTMPLAVLPGMAVAMRPAGITAAELERRMRRLAVPIVARVAKDTVLLDMRTIERREYRVIVDQLKESGVWEK